MENYTIGLTHIKEGNKILFFYPVLIIEVIPSFDNFAELNFDFGLNHRIHYNGFMTNASDNYKEKIEKTIHFELFHTFFHPQQDPNYTLFNWALFGNLAHRVICSEDGETWNYKNNQKNDFRN